jgi:ribonuclease P protein subunit POP4
MKITRAFVQGEFIGLDAKVVKSTNSSCIDIKGTIIDETRNTLTIRRLNKDTVVVKNTSIFNFVTADGTLVEVDGKIIVGRPEDRVKRNLKRQW